MKKANQERHREKAVKRNQRANKRKERLSTYGRVRCKNSALFSPKNGEALRSPFPSQVVVTIILGKIVSYPYPRAPRKSGNLKVSDILI